MLLLSTLILSSYSIRPAGLSSDLHPPRSIEGKSRTKLCQKRPQVPGLGHLQSYARFKGGKTKQGYQRMVGWCRLMVMVMADGDGWWWWLRGDGWWLMAGGRRLMAGNRNWLMADGLWLTADGWWLEAEIGWWLMVDGWWLMADGLWLTADGWWLETAIGNWVRILAAVTRTGILTHTMPNTWRAANLSWVHKIRPQRRRGKGGLNPFRDKN